MAYKIEFETATAIPTLQNTFDSDMCGVRRWGEVRWGGERIKAGRKRVYLKAAADENFVCQLKATWDIF